MPRPVVLLSNRGPVAFSFDGSGALVGRRGAGGLVTGLAPLVAGTDALWIAAAMSDGDRAAADRGIVDADDLRVRLLAIDPATYGAAYDVVCNGMLWFAHHGLFEAARRPRVDERWTDTWASYRAVNAAFADATAESAPEGAAVLVQDYHLCLVAPLLRQQRPDLRLVHFSHTPFAVPEWLLAVPDAEAVELLEGMAAHHACTFHTDRWADAFLACCRTYDVAPPVTRATPLAADADDLAAASSSAAAAAAGAELDAAIGDRKLLARVDRIELSKNILRGFLAFDVLLERHPEWRERVVFAALVYPSREGLPEYLAYRQEAEGLVARINDRWGTPGWTPILFDAADDFPRSVAALQRSDVLLVNPIRDGLNLVAKEGPLLNRVDGVLVLSTEAGAWAELGDAGVLRVNPFDVAGTAEVLHEALSSSSAGIWFSSVRGAESGGRTQRAPAVALPAGPRSPARKT